MFGRTLRVLGVAAVVVIILNGPYFLAQVRYYLNKPEPILVEEVISDEGIKFESNTLWIENLWIKAPIIYQDRVDEEQFQNNLQQGVVHYPQTARPGDFGNVYILGHSSDFLISPGAYKTVFALLPKIQIGDKIKITNTEGELFTYQVVETKVVSPSDLSVLSQDMAKKQLTLQTSYPIGTALKRFIVIANLEE